MTHKVKFKTLSVGNSTRHPTLSQVQQEISRKIAEDIDARVLEGIMGAARYLMDDRAYAAPCRHGAYTMEYPQGGYTTSVDYINKQGQQCTQHVGRTRSRAHAVALHLKVQRLSVYADAVGVVGVLGAVPGF